MRVVVPREGGVPVDRAVGTGGTTRDGDGDGDDGRPRDTKAWHVLVDFETTNAQASRRSVTEAGRSVGVMNIILIMYPFSVCIYLRLCMMFYILSVTVQE